MNCVVLFFTLIAATLVGRVVPQAIDDAPLEQEEPGAAVENVEEPRCVPMKTCGPDEEYRCCGPCYQLTCRGSVFSCGNRCFADCYCMKGFVREFHGGPCIPTMFCQQVALPVLSDYDDST